jgi:hypothetical protein
MKANKQISKRNDPTRKAKRSDRARIGPRAGRQYDALGNREAGAFEFAHCLRIADVRNRRLH